MGTLTSYFTIHFFAILPAAVSDVLPLSRAVKVDSASPPRCAVRDRSHRVIHGRDELETIADEWFAEYFPVRIALYGCIFCLHSVILRMYRGVYSLYGTFFECPNPMFGCTEHFLNVRAHHLAARGYYFDVIVDFFDVRVNFLNVTVDYYNVTIDFYDVLVDFPDVIVEFFNATEDFFDVIVDCENAKWKARMDLPVAVSHLRISSQFHMADR
jgi:hypothetical protein